MNTRVPQNEYLVPFNFGRFAGRVLAAAILAIGLLASNGAAAITATANPATVASVGEIGTRAWTNPDRAVSSNNSYATASVDGTVTRALRCTGYGFAVPVGATITGIIVNVERKSNRTTNGGASDAAMRLVKRGVIGTTDRATATTYTTADVIEAHGGGADLWGETWTPADINAADFGAAFAATKASAAGAAHTISVDHVQVTVNFSLAPFTQTASPAVCETLVDWSNPTRAMLSDNSRATASLDGTTSHFLQATGYGFAIPAGSVINGITVNVERRSSSAGNGGSRDAVVRIVKAGVIGVTDRATATSYTTGDVVEAHGGATDLWGQTWTVADINAGNFGVAFAATKPNAAGGAQTVSVDHLQIAIDYTPGPGTYSMTRSPTACASIAGIGTVNWNNPARATASDDSRARAALDGTTSRYLSCNTYNFAIPPTAIIVGITVDVERRSNRTSDGGSQDAAMRIVKGGVIGLIADDRSTTTTYTTTDVIEAHGGTSDLWGETWTPADINATTFGAAFAATKASSGGPSHNVDVDHMPITITYTIGAVGPDHYELSLPTASVACVASTVTVTACADSVSPCTNKYLAASGTTATLATGAGALGSTTVTFDATGVATTTLSYPAAANGAAASVTLSAEQTAATNPRKCCQSGVCALANSCTTTFNTAGFIFSSSAGGAVATIPAQTAGTASGSYYLRAVKTSTTTQACEAALSGANTVNLGYECNDPATCSASNLMSINGGTAITIARNNNGSVSSYTSVNMTFDANGNAPFTLTFSDVGQAKLHAAKAAGGSLLTPLAGASNSFVTAPYDFLVVPTGPYSAGVSFGARVTPRTSGGATTPNFGLESAPETVVLKPVTAAAVSASNSQLVGPVGGQIGTLTAGSFTRAKCASPASSGEVCDTALAWTEVGALLLSAATANGSGYLGSAKVPWGSVATGPFKPSFLTTELDTAQPCGTFTYSGQPFRIKVNAMSAANAVLATSAALTQNYTGAYAKDITLGSDSAGVCTPTTTGFSNNTLLGTAFPANTGFASSAPVTNTVAPLPVTYTQSLAAPAVISVCAKDTDAVNSHGQTQAVLAIRNGRLRLLNAYGSELLPLRVPVRVEYFNGTTWALNTADNCTSLPANTIVLSGGISGNTSASVVALTAGSGTLILTKPSPVATGSVDLAANLGAAGTDTSCNAATPASTAGNLQWLQFPWCAGKLDPNARAKFGSPRAPYIYLRERY
jgi:hypothetical protein